MSRDMLCYGDFASGTEWFGCGELLRPQRETESLQSPRALRCASINKLQPENKYV